MVGFLSYFKTIQFEVSQARMIQNQTQKDLPFSYLTVKDLQPDGAIMTQNLKTNQAYYIVFLVSIFQNPNFHFSTYQVQKDTLKFLSQNFIPQMAILQLKCLSIISRQMALISSEQPVSQLLKFIMTIIRIAHILSSTFSLQPHSLE